MEAQSGQRIQWFFRNLKNFCVALTLEENISIIEYSYHY